MADQCLELTAQWTSLDPVHHESAVAGTGGNTVIRVDEVEVVSGIFPALDKIVIGVAPYTCQFEDIHIIMEGKNIPQLF